MIPPETTKRTGGIFYGWFALAGGMLVIFIVGGVFVNTFGVFLPVITDDFGWSRGTVALALSLGIMSFGLPSPLFGIIVARLGPRMTIIWGNLLAAFGIAALSLIQEVWQLYALYIIIGLGAGFGGYIAGTTLLANWFVKKRPLALGMFTACGGLGGFAFPPISTALIEAIGWRLSWVTLAGMVIVIGVILGGIVLIRNRPEDMGLQPDGEDPTPVTEVKVTEPSTPVAERSTGGIRQLIKHRAVWFIGIFAAANAFAMGTMSTHQVSYVQDIGFTPMTAATTMSLLAGMSFLGSLTFGALALKMKVRYLALAGFTVELIAIAILLTSQEIGLIYVYAMLIGLGNGALSTAMPTFVGVYFHGNWYSRAIGIILPFQVVSQSIAAATAGAIFDAAGSYTPAFFMVGGFLILGTLFVTFTRMPPTAR